MEWDENLSKNTSEISTKVLYERSSPAGSEDEEKSNTKQRLCSIQSFGSGMGDSVISDISDGNSKENQNNLDLNETSMNNTLAYTLAREATSVPATGREGPIKSALSKKRAKNAWYRLVTIMRNVNIADCENMFIKDEYRNIVFDEEDLLAVINGEYVVKTPSVECDDEEDDTPSKRRVTWRESLEETFYDDEEDCLIVDISDETGATKLQNKYERKQKRNAINSSSSTIIRNSKKTQLKHN